MKKLQNQKILLLLSLLLIPSAVFADDGGNDFPIGMALAFEALATIHMSIFVFKPLSEIISKTNSNNVFWSLFVIRIVILLVFDFFITPFIAIFDFLGVFVGLFIVAAISSSKSRATLNSESNQVLESTTDSSTTLANGKINGAELRCPSCNSVLSITDKYCANCGAQFDGKNIAVAENSDSSIKVPAKKAVLSTDFDAMYSLNEDKMLEEFINRELAKAGIDVSSKLIPTDILKRKKTLNIIFSILVFVFIILIFFHFPVYTYVIGIIILFISFKATRNYNLIKYLKKEVKARPGERISNIVMNVKSTFTEDNSKGLLIIGLLVGIIAPLIIFSFPRIIYERVEGGYAVRYYIFGLTNFRTVTIPETYKNEKVVSLRGNTFSNMPLLKSVLLPDSIKEIRGQAFKNCYSLKEVNIPNSLEYLGGGAFYNAKSIEKIELPDTLNYLGGESFYGASSLESIKLSNKLVEIRGNTFEECTSLKSIKIPDNVRRIGGHAFYGATSLSEVSINASSSLEEIGSSAFRRCASLDKIILPSGTLINERAFKESPTTIYRYKINVYHDTYNDYFN